MKRGSISIFFFVFVFSFCLADGFLPGTLVVTPQGFVPIKELSVGDVVICRDTHHEFKQEKITAISHHFVHEYIQIQIGDEIIITDPNQRFYDYVHNEWVSAHNLVPFQSSISQEPIIALHQIQQDIQLYCLSVEHHHNFLITQYGVCAHNMLPAVQIIGCFTPQIVDVVLRCFAGLGAYLSAKAVVGCISKINSQKELSNEGCFQLQNTEQTQTIFLANSSQYAKTNESAKQNGNVVQKPIKVGNMKEFLNETEFGKKIKDSLDKTKKIEQGQSVYKVKDGKLENSGLKEGDQIYLDIRHKDHLEVFNANGRAKLVLNLDGTINEKKTNSKEFKSRRIN